jgi:hypothetical protein
MFLKSLALAFLVSATDAFHPVRMGHHTDPATTTAPSTVSWKVHVERDQREENDPNGRRSFMIGGTACIASLLIPTGAVRAEGGVDYKAVAKDIMALVEANPDWGPSKSHVLGHAPVE